MSVTDTRVKSYSKADFSYLYVHATPDEVLTQYAFNILTGNVQMLAIDLNSNEVQVYRESELKFQLSCVEIDFLNPWWAVLFSTVNIS